MSPNSIADRWSKLPPEVSGEIDTYESELSRFLDDKVPEKVFLEFRLRHGVYGQRQAGVQMQRIKIPLGLVNADQLEALAEVAEEYSVGIVHITTRQDFQMHYVDILDTPNLLRRLAEVGITTKEACGNTVRNVTACPYSGGCTDEAFDVTPYASKMAYFLLRHPDAQNFGRKFKVAYSGCADKHCGLARMHDIGAVGKIQDVDGVATRGFEVFVGGGLGAVPQQAKLFSEFVPADRMLPLAQAIARVFAAHGEKAQRARARMKFLVEKLGIDEFKKLVDAELENLTRDPVWDTPEKTLDHFVDEPIGEGSELDLTDSSLSAGFKAWSTSNTSRQKQAGYSHAIVFLPLGDLTSRQLRGLARIARKYTGGTLRTMVQQNFMMRWIPDGELPALYEDLKAIHLALPMANGVADLTACPGTDSCKLGIASSRGLAGILHREFLNDLNSSAGSGDGGAVSSPLDPPKGTGIVGEDGAPRNDITVKMSGCFNSCGQHHIANIGFFGTSKSKGGRVAPLFQVILGGTSENNADSYGLMAGKVAAHRAPDVVRKLIALYDAEKETAENFKNCMDRLGKKRLKEELAEFSEIGDDETYYFDNRQSWQYVKDVSEGECAGEMVTQSEFLLEDAERHVEESLLALEAGERRKAAEASMKAMNSATDGLLTAVGLFLTDEHDRVEEFRKRFADKNVFFPGLADYFFRASSEDLSQGNPERIRKLCEEANLYVEEAQVVYGRLGGAAISK